MLPESAIDREDYLSGPNGMALALSAEIDELEAHKLTLRTRAEKRPVNQKLHQLRDMLKWCKIRRGYTGNE